MNSFDFLWQMLDRHGVIERYKADCARLWDSYSLAQQRAIYTSIRAKLQTGQFVNYHPVKALRDNEPQAPKWQVLSYDDYVRQYHTTANTDGWQRRYLPNQQKTIYVKQI